MEPDTLRIAIETVLAAHDGLSLDNRDDRTTLTGALLGALRPETTEPLLILQVNCWMRWDDVRPSTDAYHRSVYAAVDRALSDYDHVWAWRVVDADGRDVADCEAAWVADRRRTLRGPEARNQDGDGPYPVQPAPIDPCDTGARLEAEYHRRAADEARAWAEKHGGAR